MRNAYETDPTTAGCLPAGSRKWELQPAAGALGVSQPTLSRTIKAIESAIGARVFNRDTRNVELTSVGAELRLIATRLVREFDSSLNELAQWVEGQRGQITIAALPSISAVLLPPALVHFRETNPGIDVTVQDSLSQPVLNSVLEGTADFGLDRGSGTFVEAGL